MPKIITAMDKFDSKLDIIIDKAATMALKIAVPITVGIIGLGCIIIIIRVVVQFAFGI